MNGLNGSIKNVVFDFGGVICTGDMDLAIESFERLGLANTSEYMNLYKQNGFFGELESGTLTAEGFCEKLRELTGRQITMDDCRKAWLSFITELPERNLQLLRQLKEEGYHLALLSNTNPFVASWMLGENFDGHGHSLKDYIENQYLSFLVRLMKPDERIFRLMLEGEGFVPEETLYVDDGSRNITVAGQLGMHTFCPINGEDWTHKILQYLR